MAKRREKTGKDIHCIMGKFNKYCFEMRAYKVEKQCLRNINLFSSEAEVLMNLLQENIDISNLSPQQVYRIRKLEYNFRQANKMDMRKLNQTTQNSDYHIMKLKNGQ